MYWIFSLIFSTDPVPRLGVSGAVPLIYEIFMVCSVHGSDDDDDDNEDNSVFRGSTNVQIPLNMYWIFSVIFAADLRPTLEMNTAISLPHYAFTGCKGVTVQFNLPDNSDQRDKRWPLPVVYPGILFAGRGSRNSVEDRENGDLGAVAPLVKGSGGSCNLVQENFISQCKIFLIVAI